MIDSWVFKGGLGAWGRLAAFFILVVGVGSYCAVRVVPLLRRRVNPIYAAHTIEQGQPSLKNSLINFLLLQGERARLPVPVYEAIERRAAQDLSTVPADSTVDRSPVIRAGYVLVGTGHDLLPLQLVLAQEPAPLLPTDAVSLVERVGSARA